MKAVILAGGGGTRLWPLSIPSKPKQFQKLVSNKSLLEHTLNRLNFLKPQDIYIATNKDQLKLVKKYCPKIPTKNIIIEPALRDTASCIGLAAAVIAKRHPKEIMAVIYADHLIKNKQEFKTKLKVAEKIARAEGTLNIIEVKAKEPNPNFGYVKLGKLHKKIAQTEVFELAGFIEKPSLEKAQKLLKSGNYLWNTGIYVWKPSDLLSAYKKHAPSSYKKIIQMQQAYDSPDQKKLLSENYPKLPKISLDYAIMEKIDPRKVRIVKADLGWSDIGNFEAIWEELSTNKSSNVSRGKTKIVDCKGCLIYSDTKNKKVAAIGLQDLVIIDTPQGLLICPKKDSKRVKEILD